MLIFDEIKLNKCGDKLRLFNLFGGICAISCVYLLVSGNYMMIVRTVNINTLIGLLFFCSCNNGQENVEAILSEDALKCETLIDTSLAKYNNEEQDIVNQDTLNYRDSEGLKQGTWKVFLNGKIWKIENYKDNLLNGKHYEYLADGEILQTDYVNGIKHGYFLHYDPKCTFARFVTYRENGQSVWSAFPWELESYIVPIKGFITNRDKIEINVPYNSGKLMYNGTIVSNEGKLVNAIGLHTAYYESGEIKALVDYDSDTIKIFNKDGELIESEKIDNWRGRRIE